MAYPDQIRQVVREGYLDGLSLEAVAGRFGVSVATVGRWRQADKATGVDWDVMRTARMAGEDGRERAVQVVLEKIMTLHQQAMEGVEGSDVSPEQKVALLASLADSLAKTTKALGRAAPRISRLGVAMEVLQLLTEYIYRQHPEHAGAFVEILEPFGVEFVKSHG